MPCGKSTTFPAHCVECSNERPAPSALARSRVARSAVARPMFVALARAYEARRQSRALLDLDDRLLRDVGITRATALRQARKPFWRWLLTTTGQGRRTG